MNPADSDTAKTAIIAALYTWIKQRPRLDYGNYASSYRDKEGRAAYFAESRAIAQNLRHARALLRAVDNKPGITAADLAESFRRAFSGRLTWDGARLDYCTGQYWPTEYRAAACAVLASALWRYWAADYPAPTGDQIRAVARRAFEPAVAKKWFN